MEAWSTRRCIEVESLSERDPKAEATVLAGIEFEYTHDLHRLIAEVVAFEGEVPFNVSEVIGLTEHAVPLRYDELLDTEPLNRQAVLALVEEVGAWSDGQLRSP